MILFPNAKINLGLHVVSKRTDGYHNIETVFYPVPLCDALEIVPSDDFSFHTYGLSIEGKPDDNLVMKAFNALQKEVAFSDKFSIHLKKAIPFGAGMGGGSSDAAFTLKIINNYLNLGLSSKKLERIAATIGADCPFFVENKPVYATGIGDVFQNVNVSLKGMHIAIVKPDIFVSAKDAYSMVQPTPSSSALTDILSMPVTEWKNVLVNDFEQSVFTRYPEIEEIKAKLYKLGAAYALMSGSGSAVFGLFNHRADIDHLFKGCYVWQGILQ